MRRRGKRAKVSVKGKRPPAPRSPKPDDARVQDLERRLAEAVKREAETREQQTATAEILRVISNSPSDYQPVFDTIVRNAGVVCGAADAILWTVEGDELVVHAHHGPVPARIGARQPIHGSVAGHAVHEARVIHIEDVTEADDFPVGRDIARRLGWRTVLSAPLLRAGLPIGAILIRRREVRPFTESQIALLQTFADQAVIAIENVRLFTEVQARNRELTESLEQQTATSEVLQVISRSPSDVEPTFEVIAASAARLCEAVEGTVFRFDGALIHIAAHCGGVPEQTAALRRLFPIPPGRGSVTARAILTRAVVHVADLAADPEHEYSALVTEGFHTVLSVPMLRNADPIGAITVRRQNVRPFSDKQIVLLQTFSDQAVIAIENVRLFKELEARNRDLTQALDRQTATADVLRIIAQSPTELQPVLDAIAMSAVRLCAASDAVIERLEGDRFYNAAHAGAQMKGLVGLPLPLSRRFPGGRAVLDRMPIIVDDITLVAESEYPDTLELLKLNTIHSVAEIPLLSEGNALGSIAVLRAEVRPFTEAEVALLQTFADQAVIAIENVRLFNETEDALERQTATSEILRVISTSPTDVQPVFDAIAESSRRLCNAFNGAVFQFDGELLHFVGESGIRREAIEVMRDVFPAPPSRDSATARAILERAVVHISNVREDSEYRTQEWASAMGIQSVLSVPMLHEGRPIGAITVNRVEAGLFPSTQVDLLKTFADQAVIAIENVRLFKELQEKNHALTKAHAQVTEALEQQTATAEILRVISQSQTDVQPVFDTIVRSAARLCDGLFSTLFQFDGELLHIIAVHNTTPEALEALHRVYPARPTRALVAARAILERTVVHISDAELELESEQRAVAHAVGWRSALIVPMLREGAPIGVVTVGRVEPGPFSDSEIELLKTFADQAVIAVENVRLFKELEARTADLTRSVEQLTALGEVGRAVSSTLDLETVLTTIVSRAVQLSGLDGGVVFEYDTGAEEFIHRAATETGGTLAEARRTTRVRKGEGVVGRTAITLEPVQVPDITGPGAYVGANRENLIESGIRAILAVPMVREGQLIGCLVVSRNRAVDFPADTIELLRTFATQSALAIQNARLFHEIADKSQQLEAASRHKSEFLANMSHELRTPLNAVIGFSEVLLQRMFGALNDKQDEYLKDIYASGQHLLSLINDILDLSKIEAGRMELLPAPFHVPSALENAVTLVRERAGRHGIALQVDIDPRLGELVGDERKVKQVVLNLLSNAVKFTPEGGRISLKASRTDGTVEIGVTDTGIGIAPEDQAAIFEEFRQVGSDETRKQEGTGLGLTLAKKFVELHGGRIWVTSEVGTGSTFTFSIPLRHGE